MMRVDDEMLMAYLDGELDDAMRGRVEAAVAADPDLQARLETQKRLRARLASHYGPIAEEPVPPRLRALLEPGLVDFAAARARRARPIWQSAAAIAATLVLGIAVGTRLPGTDGPVAIEGGAMLARGMLASALDTQLASAQAQDQATRIGISFASADGRWCRTFDGADLSGLACRRDGGWQVVMATPGTPAQQGAYRQAGGNALVMQAAQEMMAGAPLDAAAERRARDEGWRR